MEVSDVYSVLHMLYKAITFKIVLYWYLLYWNLSLCPTCVPRTGRKYGKNPIFLFYTIFRQQSFFLHFKPCHTICFIFYNMLFVI